VPAGEDGHRQIASLNHFGAALDSETARAIVTSDYLKACAHVVVNVTASGNRQWTGRYLRGRQGEEVTEVCRRLGVSEQTFYGWKKQVAGLGLSELRELRSLRHENSKLKQVVADLTLARHMLQEIVRKKL
jgi:putative transposase